MWSFNRDGECDPDLKQNREQAMHLDTPATRRARQELVDLAHPQHGVNAIADAFMDSSPVPGVVDITGANPSGDTSTDE